MYKTEHNGRSHDTKIKRNNSNDNNHRRERQLLWCRKQHEGKRTSLKLTERAKDLTLDLASARLKRKLGMVIR